MSIVYRLSWAHDRKIIVPVGGNEPNIYIFMYMNYIIHIYNSGTRCLYC